MSPTERLAAAVEQLTALSRLQYEFMGKAIERIAHGVEQISDEDMGEIRRKVDDVIKKMDSQTEDLVERVVAVFAEAFAQHRVAEKNEQRDARVEKVLAGGAERDEKRERTGKLPLVSVEEDGGVYLGGKVTGFLKKWAVAWVTPTAILAWEALHQFLQRVHK